jgi:xanthine dehydrogenase accessory factor
MKGEILSRIFQDREAKQPVALVTRMADGQQVLVYKDQSPYGELELSAEQQEKAQNMLHTGRSGKLPDSGGALFVRSYVPPYRLIIVGAVHIAQKLAPIATEVGYQVIVVDPRRAFATKDRFPGIELLCEWPDEALKKLRIDSQTAVVTLTHDPKIDDPAIIEALNSSAFYIGCLGSTRTHAKRVERLTEAGLAEHLERLHAPVGLNLGGRSPAEVAVATLAQIIQVRYAR